MRPRMIDAAGDIRLFRAGPTESWHVLARADDADLEAACGIRFPVADTEGRTLRADHLLSAGRICLDCAQALLRAG
jgi:hypothetical protein